MKTSKVLMLLICLMVSACASTNRSFESAVSSMIFEFQVTGNLEDEIGPGGLEMTARGSTYYYPNLMNCGHEVLEAGEEWAKKNRLSIIKKLDEKNRSLIHIMSKPFTKAY